jgi:hypothetical protein
LRQLYLNRCAPHTSCLGTNLPKHMQNNVSGCCGSLQPYACMVAAHSERQANLCCAITIAWDESLPKYGAVAYLTA